MVTNRPTGQHFVQKEYLRSFCDADGKLQAHYARSRDGKLDCKWIDNNPEGSAIQRDIYTLNGEPESPYRIETNHFGQIEPPGMAAIHRILSEHPDRIGPGIMAGLSPYIANAAVRVPSALKLKAIMQPEMDAGRVVGEPIHVGAAGIPEEAKAIGSKLRDFKFYAKFFDGRTGTQLATSDRPIGLYALAEPDHQTKRMLPPSPIDSSLPDCWSKDVVCTFPISTHCVVLGIKGIKGTKGRLNSILKGDLSLGCHEHLAGWVNAMTGFNANWIYSANRNVQFLSLSKMRNLIGIANFIAETTAFAETNYEDWPA